MASWPSATRVVLGVPAIEHVDGKIMLTPEIVNVSGVPMRNLQCTDIALGSARRLSPPPESAARLSGGAGHARSR